MIQKQNHIKEEVHIEIEAKKYKPNVTARVRKKNPAHITIKSYKKGKLTSK